MKTSSDIVKLPQLIIIGLCEFRIKNIHGKVSVCFYCIRGDCGFAIHEEVNDVKNTSGKSV